MAVKRVIKGVHIIPMAFANAFLVEGDDGLTLIGAGYPRKEAGVFGGDLWAWSYLRSAQAPDLHPQPC